MISDERAQQEIARIRYPKRDEMFAVVTEMLRAGKLRADCEDGNHRLCRIRGKIRRRLWIRNGDLILIKPWEIEEKEKADVLWRYTRTQAMWLKNRRRFKNIVYE